MAKMVLGSETKLVAFWLISSLRCPRPRIGALLGAHEFLNNFRLPIIFDVSALMVDSM